MEKYQLEKLVSGIRSFSDTETGLFSRGITPGGGWGVEKRLEFARSLSDGGLLDFITDEMEISGIDPERVYFEITETAAISHLDHAMRLIGALRQFGCRFVLDDFGRGLSSFAYLRDLKVDLLKIDGEFVRGLAGDTIHRAMVASIHQVGRVMGLSTIAEGVEDLETFETLGEMGLDYAQGYFIHRPEALIHDR